MRARYPVAAHIFLLKADAVLLLRRANTGYEDGNFGVVAGHVEFGESVSQAALREIQEEVGVIVQPTFSRLALCIGFRTRNGSTFSWLPVSGLVSR